MIAPFRSALVLTAGLGTRLRPLTLARAKAAVPVDGEPLVRRVIRWLASSGVRDLVLNLHHQPSSITAVVGDGSDLGVRVRYSWEATVLGSAGGPRHALPLLLDAERGAPVPAGHNGRLPPALLLVNGDTLTDVDLTALAEDHARTNAWVTMALIPNPRPDKYGGVVVDDAGVVTGFTKRGSGVPSFHFIGVQATDARVWAELEDGVFAESVLEVYPRLMRDWPGRVRGFVTKASFHDIGTAADLLGTSLALAAQAGREDHPAWGAAVAVHPSARVTRSLLWDHVTVGERAVLDECIVADGVTIAAGESFVRKAIVNDPDGARVIADI